MSAGLPPQSPYDSGVRCNERKTSSTLQPHSDIDTVQQRRVFDGGLGLLAGVVTRHKIDVMDLSGMQSGETKRRRYRQVVKYVYM